MEKGFKIVVLYFETLQTTFSVKSPNIRKIASELIPLTLRHTSPETNRCRRFPILFFLRFDFCVDFQVCSCEESARFPEPRSDGCRHQEPWGSLIKLCSRLSGAQGGRREGSERPRSLRTRYDLERQEGELVTKEGWDRKDG